MQNARRPREKVCVEPPITYVLHIRYVISCASMRGKVSVDKLIIKPTGLFS